MTSKFVVGATTNSAPARIAARAVSGSSTVPTPNAISSGRVFASSAITPIAFGVLIVISMHFTPPSFSASNTGITCAGSAIRSTATTPVSATN